MIFTMLFLYICFESVSARNCIIFANFNIVHIFSAKYSQDSLSRLSGAAGGGQDSFSRLSAGLGGDSLSRLSSLSQTSEGLSRLSGLSQGLSQAQDSLARISSMTNSISPPQSSNNSLSPGKLLNQACSLTTTHWCVAYHRWRDILGYPQSNWNKSDSEGKS